MAVTRFFTATDLYKLVQRLDGWNVKSGADRAWGTE